jgi:signal peptidase I
MEDPGDTLNGEGTEPSHETPPQPPSGATSEAEPVGDTPAVAAPFSPPPSRARRWWLAFLLTLVAPPAGQVYNGQPRKGLVVVLCIYLVGALGAMIALLHLPFWLPSLLVGLALALQIYLLVDAIVQAIRAGSTYRLRRYNRWFVFLPLLAVFYLAPRVWIRAVNQVVQTFYIPSGSNEPTVLVGDHLFVDRWSHRFTAPKRGGLVVFRSPESPAMVLERAVALGGDRVEIRDKRLLLNGRALAEPYAVHNDPQTYGAGLGWRSQRDNLPPQTIPAGFIFVLGDNRDNSYDSRFYGPIRQDAVVGGGRLRVYWSWDASRHATRWERTGRFLE